MTAYPIVYCGRETRVGLCVEKGLFVLSARLPNGLVLSERGEAVPTLHERLMKRVQEAERDALARR